MAETTGKYSKYFVTDTSVGFEFPEQLKMIEDQKNAGNYVNFAPQYYINNENVKGSFFVMSTWTVSMCGTKPVQLELKHTHTYDEVLGFIGSDPSNVTKLGGEVEIWMEDEKYVMDKSFLVYIPKGLKHCPIIIRKVDRPFLGYAVGLSGEYATDWQESYKGMKS
jgi:hypothetical protein